MIIRIKASSSAAVLTVILFIAVAVTTCTAVAVDTNGAINDDANYGHDHSRDQATTNIKTKRKATTTTTKKPNIMIVFADDVGTGDVPGYWDTTSLVDMPNVQALMDSGTSFTDAHSTPLCAPSRYVLLSGNYQHRGVKFGGTWNVNYEGNQFRRQQKSIAQILGQNGYKTSMVGKWHLVSV